MKESQLIPKRGSLLSSQGVKKNSEERLLKSFSTSASHTHGGRKAMQAKNSAVRSFKLTAKLPLLAIDTQGAWDIEKEEVFWK